MAEFDLFAIIIGSLLKVFLVFIILGTIVIVLVEAINAFTHWRGKVLKKFLLKAIGDQKLYAEIMAHPILISLGKYPPYINLDYFVLAVKDIIEKNEGQDSDKNRVKVPESNNFIKVIRFLRQDSSVPAGDDDREYKSRLRNWLMELMRIASGRYGLQVQSVVFIISMILVVFLNLDIFEWLNAFNQNALGESLIKLAESNDKIDKAALRAVVKEAKIMPIGWSAAMVPSNMLDIILKVAGLFTSTIMTAFSALVSFQLLTKFVNVRGTGTKPTYN